MFDYDELITEALTDPDQVWSRLDSFWRANTAVDTRDLVQYQTWASTLLLLDAHSKSRHYLSTQTVPELVEYWKIPWFPLVLYQDRLESYEAVEYGDGDDYSPVPEISYGDTTGTVVYRYRLPQDLMFFEDVPTLVDAVTDSRVVIDPSQFSYDKTTGVLEMVVDPYTLVDNRVSSDGRTYIVLWARNPSIDLDVPFDQVGWVVKYDKTADDHYADTLRHVWDLALRGPSISRYKTGLTATLGLPYADTPAQVLDVQSDGYQWVISTASQSYTVLASRGGADVLPGDEVYAGQPLSDTIEFLEFQDVLSASATTLSGLALDVPLSTGVAATLTFANTDTAWTYDAGRPSPWRFPVGGDAADIEQFWVDVDSYAVANSIDFATLYGLPDSVNPMKRVVEDLLRTHIFVAALDLEEVSGWQSFADRARLLVSPGTLLVLHQDLPPASDSTDLGVTTSETVGYGYNEAATPETISVSGTDLTYTDLTPLVLAT